MTLRFGFGLFGLVLAVAGCGSSSPTTPGGNNNSAFSAKIDGVAWNAVALATSAHGSANGTYTLVGGTLVAGQPVMSLTFYNIAGPGTYPMGVGGSVPGGTSSLSVGAGLWATPLTGAAGTVTLTAVSATHITGTFAFTATPTVGSGSNRVVTQGSFDLPVTSTGSVAVPDYVGNTFGGTLGGAPWNAATVVMVVKPSSGTLTVGASNDSYNVNIIISGLTGVGSYGLGTGVSRQVQVIRTGTTQNWGGSLAGSTGTVTITSLTATRVKGAYSVTLVPGVGTAGTLTLTGNYDVGIQP